MHPPLPGAADLLVDALPELGETARGLSFPQETDCGGDPEWFVRLLGAGIELQRPEAVIEWAESAAGSAGLATLLDAARRVDVPATGLVLAAIGEHHPDKGTAKVARTALFRHRTSQGR